jgi:hypothetical protein
MTTTEGLTTSQSATAAGTDERSLPQQAASEVRTLADEAKSTGAHVARDVRQQLRTQADEQTARVAESLRQFAAELQQMSRAGGDGTASDLAMEASTTVERLASRLGGGGLDSVLDDAKRFARNRPGTFLLASAAAGVVTARLLKASDTQRLVRAVKDEGSSKGSTQDSTRAVMEGSTQGSPPGSMQGAGQGTPQGTTQDAPQDTAQGTTPTEGSPQGTQGSPQWPTEGGQP